MKGSFDGMKPAREGSSIERQWDENPGSKPAEAMPSDAATPGCRVANRTNTSTPPGGEGNGRNSHATTRGKGPKY